MGHYLLAVLVGDNATVETIDTHLAKPMRRLLRAHRVDDYRFGGGVTSAWDKAPVLRLVQHLGRTGRAVRAQVARGVGRWPAPLVALCGLGI